MLFAEVTLPHATSIVCSFLEGVSETKFGFPSGVFRVEERKTTVGRVTVTEMQPPYSVTDGCAAAGGSLGMEMISGADGCIEVLIAIFLLVVVLGPILILNVTEKIFRKLLQSEVRADLEEVTDPDGTLVTVRLRGVSAIFMKSAYQEALADPQLPDDIAVAAGVKVETVPVAGAVGA